MNKNIQEILNKHQKLVQIGLSYIQKDKERAKFFFRLASSELEKLQDI